MLRSLFGFKSPSREEIERDVTQKIESMARSGSNPPPAGWTLAGAIAEGRAQQAAGPRPISRPVPRLQLPQNEVAATDEEVDSEVAGASADEGDTGTDAVATPVRPVAPGATRTRPAPRAAAARARTAPKATGTRTRPAPKTPAARSRAAAKPASEPGVTRRTTTARGGSPKTAAATKAVSRKAATAKAATSATTSKGGARKAVSPKAMSPKAMSPKAMSPKAATPKPASSRAAAPKAAASRSRARKGS